MWHGGGGGFYDGGNFRGGIEAAVTANIIFDFLLGATALVEFLGVGVVPAGESDLRRRSMTGQDSVSIRVWRQWRENWE